ncbi:MAG: 6,7-dimethyl-8-ribityllumazine synthase [Parcubacteria group bacterium CG11_big_fil_rev_8_21_14_0_20_39_22]|nr:MAG: 6,7-dimethyl-8-ribityllumazine synthase [Parcubacteria group bacterium CG11_big_fil_rev_8_21_14_0_20_39_22]
MQRKKQIKSKIENKKVSSARVAIVVSAFNSDITESLLSGSKNVLNENNVSVKDKDIYRVPGSFELPLACLKIAESGNYDGIIALGSVIKGGTDHYYYVAGESARGIMDVMLKTSVPIGFGIITTDNLKDAKARSGIKNNKGREAADALLSMISIF